MEGAYAQALWESVKKGKSPKEATHALAEMLKRQGRSELMHRIGLSLKKLAAREDALRPKIYVAREKDAKHALTESGVENADIKIDESLIGGWRLESAEKLVDNSFKNKLLSIYSNVTE